MSAYPRGSMTTRSLRTLAGVAAGVLVIAGSGTRATLQQPAQQQVPGAIRSRITLVPLDVRVLDRAGRPVTDLTQADFTVLEDGVPQKVGHFSLQELAAEAPGPARPSLRKALDATVEEQRHRTFLVVLGRGRLQYPARGYDGLIRFVREQLLPQDKIAIAAWNRTTDFTTDRSRLIPLLERLRATHETIEAKLRHRESGLEAIYGSKTIPESIQQEIDAAFDDDALRPRELASVRIRDQEELENAGRRETAAIMDRMAGEGARLDDPRLEEFFRHAYLGRQTLTTLYASIEYLKYFDGEKHLVLLTEGGIYLPRADDDRGLAATAADARVAVHTILTGGLRPVREGAEEGADMGLVGVSGSVQKMWNDVVLGTGPGTLMGDLFATGTMRTFSQMSGGFSTASSYAARAFDRIDAATRSQYVLGYYPANASWDGDYRKIDVKVNRPGVTVTFRRGYFATDQLVPFDRREFLTYSRIASAGYYARAIDDIRITLKASASGPGEVVAEGTIDPSRLTLEEVDGIRGGQIDLAIYIADRREEIIGERWHKIDMKLGATSYGRMVENGIPFSVRIPVKGTPRYVKAIAYDYASDLVGSAMLRMR